MKRRDFFGMAAKGAVGAAALSLTGCEDSVAQAIDDRPVVNWRMATSWPASLDTLYGGAQSVSEWVSALTGGRFTITPYTAGEIVAGLEVMPAVEAGTVECGHTCSYYYYRTKGSFLNFITTVPFGLTARQQNAWLYDGGGLTLLQQMFAAKYGMILFPAGNTGAQMGGWFNTEVNELSDLDGLKIRCGGLGGEVLNRLGAETITVAGGQIAAALQDGTVDAAEWVGPYDDERLGLHEVAEYYYIPGWWEPTCTVDLQINLEAWNALPVGYQKILEAAACQANMTMLSRYDSRNYGALQRLIAGGTLIRTFSDEILEAAYETTLDVMGEYAADDADFATVFNAWNAFRTGVQSWHSTNELAYMKFIAAQI